MDKRDKLQGFEISQNLSIVNCTLGSYFLTKYEQSIIPFWISGKSFFGNNKQALGGAKISKLRVYSDNFIAHIDINKAFELYNL